MLSTLLVLSYMACEDIMACTAHVSGWATPRARNGTHAFRFHGICLVPSPSQTSPLWGATYWNVVVLPRDNYRDSVHSYIPGQGSMIHMLTLVGRYSFFWSSIDEPFAPHSWTMATCTNRSKIRSMDFDPHGKTQIVAVFTNDVFKLIYLYFLWHKTISHVH